MRVGAEDIVVGDIFLHGGPDGYRVLVGLDVFGKRRLAAEHLLLCSRVGRFNCQDAFVVVALDHEESTVLASRSRAVRVLREKLCLAAGTAATPQGMRNSPGRRLDCMRRPATSCRSVPKICLQVPVAVCSATVTEAIPGKKLWTIAIVALCCHQSVG
jgi:hypothetical protein